LELSATTSVGEKIACPAGGDGIEFLGQSFIAAPSGEINAQGSVDKEELVIAAIDWKRVDEHRTHGHSSAIRESMLIRKSTSG
jgi:predicted amidohydrolase